MISPGNDQSAKRRKITKITTITPIIIGHLKFLQITNRNVFHGDVNQRNDVFGRLKHQSFGFRFFYRKEKTNFGSSNADGPSRAFPTGFFSASSAVTNENSTSTFPYHSNKNTTSFMVHFCLPLINQDHEFRPFSSVQSLATNLNPTNND